MQKNLNRNIKGNKYKQLKDHISKSSTTFSFVTREDIGISDNSIRLIGRSVEFLVDSYPTNEWLTNEIIDSTIIGHIYFYDKEKNPLLYVNGHENYAVIEVSSLKDYLKIALL